MALKIGQVVERIEEKITVRATILEIERNNNILITYEEGGEGWWPLFSLKTTSPKTSKK